LAHRTVRCATGHVRCTRETSRLNSSLSGISSGDSAIIHRTVRCTPDMSGAPRKSRLRNSPGSVFHLGCFAKIHRTVRCTPDCPVYTGLSGATAGQRLLPAPTATCSAFIARQRAQRSGTPMLAHLTLYSTCPVRHRTSRRAQKTELQRSTQRLYGDVAGAPDMSGVHRTVRCTIRQTAPPTVKFGGWGYKYPNHPTIHCIQVFQLQPLYKS
jgi:hypothetical protein